MLVYRMGLICRYKANTQIAILKPHVSVLHNEALLLFSSESMAVDASNKYLARPSTTLLHV